MLDLRMCVIWIQMYRHTHIRMSHTKITEYLTNFTPQQWQFLMVQPYDLKAFPGALPAWIHHTNLQFSSKTQTYKAAPQMLSHVQPTYFHKCKFSFTYFTSDHTYVYKNTKWQTHSQMSSHTTHPIYTHETDRCTRWKPTHALSHTFIRTNPLVYT